MTTNQPEHDTPRPGQPPRPGDERLAALSYLSVPFLGPCLPLAVCVLARKRPGSVRRHSIQALNLSVTALLYLVCALIAGLMLALDTLTAALSVVIPVAAAGWLAVAGYAIAAAASARHGGFRRLPAWLCATIVRERPPAPDG